MICLLCDYTTNDVDNIKKHYLVFHKINENNYFFKEMVLEMLLNQNSVLNTECIRCGCFISTVQHKTSHNFLKHYIDGERKPAELKPIDVVEKDGLISFSISYDKYSDEYNFFNSEELVEDFLFNIKRLYKPGLNKAIFKESFSIENAQNSPLTNPDFSEMKRQRFWTTKTYKGKYFNDFISSGIRGDILSRIINNDLTGRSWHFNGFIKLSLNVLFDEFVLHNT